MPIKLYFGSLEEYVFVMPNAYDDDFEEVTISINMDNIDQFAVWDSEAKTVTFKLVEGVPIGLYRAKVTLDDSILKSYY